MSISSIFFIFIFLPLTLAAYYLVPRKGKNLVLLIASLLFYAWGSPIYLALLMLSTVFNYACARDIEAQLDAGAEKAAKRALIRGVIFNAAVLGFFKYYAFVLENLNRILPKDIPIQPLALPLGISFFTFSVISCLVDVYRRKAPAERNIIAFGVYTAFFAKVTSGPIVRYADMADQIKPHPLRRAQLGSGMAMFVRGLGKKALLADYFGSMHSYILGLEAGQMTLVTAWLSVIAYTMQIYFDFSGYSDMAIGLGRMFGFKLTQNFDYPYISKSITEFWRRWHMTLGTWFREYVYIPLGGNRAGKAKHIRNILIVWMLTGIWHGAAWNFILWGLYYGILLLIEKYFLKDRLDRAPAVVSHIYTMFFVIIGWGIFAAPSLSGALTTLGQLIGIGCKGGLINGITLYLLRTNLVQLIFACFCATPVVFDTYRRLTLRGSEQRLYISCAIYAVVFLLAVACLISATYQSFLYVQF